MTVALSATIQFVLGTPPLDPDGPTAQHWLRQELAKPEYQAAKPTWFDRLAQQISDWFGSLGANVSGDAGWIIASIGIAIVAALVIGALVIFGLPRLTRRATADVVFDEHDRRGAEQLRRDAAAAASAGRFDDAVRELFRAIARSLGERTIVLMLPGTTAQEFATMATAQLPSFAPRLHEAAVLFDDVRYLGKPAGADDYSALVALDLELAKARPTPSALVGDATAGAGRR